MKIPSIRQFQYLLAVVELRHFGKAAKRCCVTQSTLSTGIQELENLLDVQLFERTKRKVMPTIMGIEIAQTAEQILRLSQDVVEQAHASHATLNGPLRLGIIPTIAPFLLPKTLPSIRQQYSKLALYLVEEQSQRLLARLNAADLDCAILALPYALSKLESFIFHSEMFWIALPKQHPLAQQASIRPEALPLNELLLLEEGHCLRDHVLAVAHRSELPQSTAFQGTSLYTLIEMVANGLGITFVPEMALDSSLLKQQNITLKPLAEPGPHRDIALVWRSTYPHKQDMQALGQCLQQQMQR